MKSVIIDTSSILFGLSSNIDPFARLKENFPDRTIVVSTGIIRELTLISKEKRKESVHARIGLALIKKYGVKVVRGDEYVDTWIIKHSLRAEVVVCTNDVELKQRLGGRGCGVFSLSRSGLLR
ncbi:MAG: hypothetical protein KGH61_01130 [Candidatus Micrarchaeota archaeon]|nr:hypothetical protein [Candidatus Micrarchaeota archaeon]MDE1847536.1 hypothetical protein [Candidatus Micrarchaeota archaeon]MDE1864253.1 hypothetical protein [Candidatus Micrarchaeota archaeon]